MLVMEEPITMLVVTMLFSGSKCKLTHSQIISTVESCIIKDAMVNDCRLTTSSSGTILKFCISSTLHRALNVYTQAKHSLHDFANNTSRSNFLAP